MKTQRSWPVQSRGLGDPFEGPNAPCLREGVMSSLPDSVCMASDERAYRSVKEEKEECYVNLSVLDSRNLPFVCLSLYNHCSIACCQCILAVYVVNVN